MFTMDLMGHLPKSIKSLLFKNDYWSKYDIKAEKFYFNDKGMTLLYWYRTSTPISTQTTSSLNNSKNSKTCKNLICIHPGINFDGVAGYIENTIQNFTKLDHLHDIVVISTRGGVKMEDLANVGLDKTRNKMGKYVNNDDTAAIYQHLYSLNYGGYVAVGYSLGGLILTNYLTNWTNRVKYSAIVHSPTDLSICDQFGCYFMQLLIGMNFKQQIRNSLEFYESRFQANKSIYSLGKESKQLNDVDDKIDQNKSSIYKDDTQMYNSVAEILNDSLTNSDIDFHISRIVYSINNTDNEVEKAERKTPLYNSLLDQNELKGKQTCNYKNNKRVYHSLNEYYFDNNNVHKLRSNEKPMLVFMDRDDCVVPIHHFNHAVLNFYQNVILIETKGGGHLGTLESWFKYYYGRTLTDYINFMEKHYVI